MLKLEKNPRRYLQATRHLSLMKAFFVCFLYLLLFVSCEPEPETSLELVFENELSIPVEISIFWSIANSDSAFIKDLIPLNPNGSSILNYYAEGAAYDDFPGMLISTMLRSDSIVVTFGDTLLVKHYPENLSTNPGQYSLDSNGLLNNQVRNIYNANSYLQSKKGENWFEGRYTFGQDDLDYAISIFE